MGLALFPTAWYIDNSTLPCTQLVSLALHLNYVLVPAHLPQNPTAVDAIHGDVHINCYLRQVGPGNKWDENVNK